MWRMESCREPRLLGRKKVLYIVYGTCAGKYAGVKRNAEKYAGVKWNAEKYMRAYQHCIIIWNLFKYGANVYVNKNESFILIYYCVDVTI